jgi:hypothetical protein
LIIKKKEEGRGKKEEGRRKKEEGRKKKEERRRKNYQSKVGSCASALWLSWVYGGYGIIAVLRKMRYVVGL